MSSTFTNLKMNLKIIINITDILDSLKLSLPSKITEVFAFTDLPVVIDFSSPIIESTNTLPIALDVNLSLNLGVTFASILFLIGLFGIFWNQKNIIIVFLCVELMLFGAGLHFLFYYLFFNDALGQIFALLILTVATAETAIGLGIIMLAYRLNKSVSFEAFTTLRG